MRRYELRWATLFRTQLILVLPVFRVQYLVIPWYWTKRLLISQWKNAYNKNSISQRKKEMLPKLSSIDNVDNYDV